MNTKREFLVWLLCLGLFQAVSGQVDPSTQSMSIPLEKILKEDGSFDFKKDFSGTLDPKGWRLTQDDQGAPRFVRKVEKNNEIQNYQISAGSPEDENWDDRFYLPQFNGEVYAVAVNGNDVYCGGSFSNANNIGIVKWDGNRWSTLGHGVNGAVRAIAVNGTDVYVGGDFTQADGIGVNHIAKWDGNQWSALESGVDGTVNAIAIHGYDIFIGGIFKNAGNINVNRIARWNGQRWFALGSGVNSDVLAIAVSGNNIYVGGKFSNAGGVSVNYIAKWNGTSWSSVGNGIDGHVSIIAVNGSDIYVGGCFVKTGDLTLRINNIAKWNGSSWSVLGSGIPDALLGVSAIVVHNNEVYLAYTKLIEGYTIVNIVKWALNGWQLIGYAFYDFYYNPSINIKAMVSNGGYIYLGGLFKGLSTNNSTEIASSMARWNGSRFLSIGNLDGKGIGGVNTTGSVTALANIGSDVYVGGFFNDVGNIHATGIAKWNGSNWSALANGMTGIPSTIQAGGNDVYVGSEFNNGGNNVAKWNGSVWSVPGSGVNNKVYAIAVDGNGVYAGGAFTQAGGINANRIARWNGSSWLVLGSGVDDTVKAVAVNGTDVYAGGSFRNAGGIPVNYVAKWNGGSWSALGSGVSGKIHTLTVTGNSVYAYGANFLARWNGNGWSETPIHVNGEIKVMRNNGNILYFGGSFTTVNDVSANNIIKWEGNNSTWKALGSGVNGPVNAIAIVGDNVHLGGEFTAAGGKQSQLFAIWHERSQLAVDSSSWSVPSAGGNSPSVNVMNATSGAVITYSISDNADWLSTSSTGGSTPGAFILTASANGTGSTRTGIVTITAVSPSGVFGSPQTITATQLPMPSAAASIQPVSPDTAQADSFWVEIKVGNPNPIDNLFGASFDLCYSSTAYVDYIGSETGSFLGSDLVFLATPDDANGKVSVGITRKVGTGGIDGSGALVRIKFRVSPNSPYGTKVVFSLANITAIDPAGSPIELTQATTDTLTIMTLMSVWPGDTNNDGIVNQADVLPIGLYWNKTGPIRPNHSNAWTAQVCQSWVPKYASYADANGDSTVNQMDIFSIGLNWGKTHAVAASGLPALAKTKAISTLRAEQSKPNRSGECFVDIWVGNEQEPVKNLYGVSFVLDLGSSKPEVIQVEPGSFLGDDVLFLPQANREKGVVSFGMTRKGGQDGAGGTGVLARVKLKLDNPSSALDMTIREIEANDPEGNPVHLIALGSTSEASSEQNVNIPTEYALYQNHPNPFNPTTTIRYALPNESDITLKIYDGLGRVVATLVEGYESAGEHEVLFDAKELSSGLYYCRMQSGTVVLTRKLLLLR